MDELHLIMFSRAPLAGQTKTRLAAAVGEPAAAAFHVACLHDLSAECARAVQIFAPLRVRRHLFVTPAGSGPLFRDAGVDGLDDFLLHDQRGVTLGERMAHALREVLHSAQRPARTLLFGSDLPLLTCEHLGQAYRALDNAAAVFCPTLDGGYGLVGLAEPQDRLFALAAFGHGQVLAQTLALARSLNLPTALLEPLPDVDTLDDLPAVLAHPLCPALAQRRSVRWIAAHVAHNPRP